MFPGTPLWTGGDQAIWLHDGQRMFYGDVLYRDFFQLTFPGTELLYFSLFKVFGLRTWIPNALLVLLGAALTWLIYFIASRVLTAKQALVPAMIFLTLIFHDLFDATHHWFSIAAVAAALALIVERRTPPRLLFSGLFCGLSTCFTQSHGAAAAAGFALFLYLEQKQAQSRVLPKGLWKNYVIFATGFFSSVLPITLPFVWKAGVERFFFCTFLFLVRYYGTTQAGGDWHLYMIGLPERLHTWPWHLAGFLLVHSLLPLIYLIVLLRYFRRQLPGSPQHCDRILLIALVGFFLFLSVASSPGWNRLYYVCFPALILFGCFLAAEGKRGRIMLDALLSATLILAVATPLGTQTEQWVYMDLPGGRTAFDGAHVERYRWVRAQTRPSGYFFGGFYPDFYFLLDLRNPGSTYFVTADDFTRPNDVANAISGIERHHVRLLLWAARLDLPPDPSADHLGPLRAYIRSHYCVLRSFPIYEAWARVDNPAASSRLVPACPQSP